MIKIKASKELDSQVHARLYPESAAESPLYSQYIELTLPHLERNCPDLCFKRMDYGRWEAKWSAGHEVVVGETLAVALCRVILSLKGNLT